MMSDPGAPDRWLFDFWSRCYDAPLVQRLAYRPVHDALLAALRRTRHRRVLDVGCGTGMLPMRLSRELDGIWVVGCDFSCSMLQHAARRGPEIPWVQGDALRLPFCDNSFDTVVSTDAFHWFSDQNAALAEFHRVLRPEGRLLVALVNPPLEFLSEAFRLGAQLLGEPFYWPTRERMRQKVEAAGFRVESQGPVFRVPAGLILAPVLTAAVRAG